MAAPELGSASDRKTRPHRRSSPGMDPPLPDPASAGPALAGSAPLPVFRRRPLPNRYNCRPVFSVFLFVRFFEKKPMFVFLGLLLNERFLFS